MRGRGWLVLTLAVGCATGVEDEPPITTFGLGDDTASVTPGDDSDTDGATSQGSGNGTGSPTSGTDTGMGMVDETGNGETSPPNAEESSGEPPGVCTPEVGDVPCVTCVKTECCDEYLTCLGDESCSCTIDCLLAGGDTATCFIGCGATPPALDLFNCGAMPCDLACDPPR